MSETLCCTGEAKKKKKKKKPKKKKNAQTEPPRVAISKLFPDGNYPEGELQEYKDECAHIMRSQVLFSLLSSVTPGEQHPKKSDMTSEWQWKIRKLPTKIFDEQQRSTDKYENTPARLFDPA